MPKQELRQKTNKARRTAAFFARRCFCHLLFRSLYDISALMPNILQKTLTVIVTKKRAKQTTRKKNRRPGRATTTRTKTERTTTTTPCQQQHKRRSRRSRRRPPSPLHLPKSSQQQKRIWLTPLLRASLASLLGARSGPSRPPIHSSLEDRSRRPKAALFSIFVRLISLLERLVHKSIFQLSSLLRVLTSSARRPFLKLLAELLVSRQRWGRNGNSTPLVFFHTMTPAS